MTEQSGAVLEPRENRINTGWKGIINSRGIFVCFSVIKRKIPKRGRAKKEEKKIKGPGEDRTRDHQITGFLKAHCNLMLYH